MHLDATFWFGADARPAFENMGPCRCLQTAFHLDAYLVVYSPRIKGPEVFQQSVLPFGFVASATAFLRVAQAIWKIGTTFFLEFNRRFCCLRSSIWTWNWACCCWTDWRVGSHPLTKPPMPGCWGSELAVEFHIDGSTCPWGVVQVRR